MKSRPNKDRLRVGVLDAARALSEAAAACRRIVAADAGRCWVWRDEGVSAQASAVQVAAWAMTELDYYRDDQDPLDTLCAPGLIEVGADGLAAINRLNTAKAEFQARCADAAHLQAELNGRRLPVVTVWLHRNGFPRINRRQAYRQIAVLDQRPAYIGYSWSNTQLTYLRNRAQVERLIMTRVDDDHVGHYLDELNRLPDEVFAQRVGVNSIRPSCNIRYDSEAREHKKTPLPVAIRRGWWPQLRAINPRRAPTGKPGRASIIEPAPWVAELGIYRYLPGHRHAADHPTSNTTPKGKKGHKKGYQA